jgi:hypothetical protein
VLTGTGRKLESAQRTSSPSASIPLTGGAAGNPTNEHHQEGGHEAGEKTEVARMHVLGAGGVDGDEEGEGQPPTHTHQQHRRWQAAGEAGRRLLPRARSLALEFNSPDPLAPTQLTFSVSATVCSVLNLIQMVIFIR